jgi:hypothetical protein
MYHLTNAVNPRLYLLTHLFFVLLWATDQGISSDPLHEGEPLEQGTGACHAQDFGKQLHSQLSYGNNYDEFYNG